MRPILWCRKVNGMPVVMLSEYDNPQDEERNKRKRKFSSEVMRPHWEKLLKEKGIKVESSGWSDNTGHMVFWNVFETMEDFAKIWEDEKWQQIRTRWPRFVDNLSYRLMRPALNVPEDLFK